MSTVVLLPEAIAFAMYVVHAVHGVRRIHLEHVARLFRRDVRYDIRALWGALFPDSSTKVDILMLGAFTDARTTGIYTFISLASDLFLQFTSLLRSWVNPRITEAFVKHDADGFRQFILSELKRSYVLGIGFLMVLSAAFIVVTTCIPDYAVYREGIPAMVVLCSSLALCAGFFPLLQVFGQIGRPTTQSATFVLLFGVNVLFNLLFIPWFGMVGAALGTGLAYMVYAMAFVALVNRLKFA